MTHVPRVDGQCLTVNACLPKPRWCWASACECHNRLFLGPLHPRPGSASGGTQSHRHAAPSRIRLRRSPIVSAAAGRQKWRGGKTRDGWAVGRGGQLWRNAGFARRSRRKQESCVAPELTTPLDSKCKPSVGWCLSTKRSPGSVPLRQVAEVWSIQGQIWPISSNFGTLWPVSAPFRPNSGQLRPIPRRFRPGMD